MIDTDYFEWIMAKKIKKDNPTALEFFNSIEKY